MADVEIRGVRLHVQRLSRPDAHASASLGAVVFVHGAMGNMSVFYYTLANQVALAGYDVVLYDLRGHGLSQCPPHGYLVEDLVADLEALLASVEPDRPVHLIGYSLGGAIAQRLTVERPDLVASLILVEGLIGTQSPGSRPLWERDWISGSDDGADRVADAVIAQHPGKGARWAKTTRRLLTQTTFLADVATVRVPESEVARRTLRPTLVLSGDRSEFYAAATRTAGLIADCTIRVLTGFDHYTIVVDGAVQVRRHALAWLEAQTAQSTGQRRWQSGWHDSFSSSPL
ncbi:MAG: hypothetical protein QOH12_951 [Solirubrobacteraceae bacterium]|nr:hypothetical protein [Solirubrobacteraceae bacterium]